MTNITAMLTAGLLKPRIILKGSTEVTVIYTLYQPYAVLKITPSFLTSPIFNKMLLQTSTVANQETKYLDLDRMIIAEWRVYSSSGAPALANSS